MIFLMPLVAFAKETKKSDESISVPIIMYHSLSDKASNDWILSPSQFESDLKYLSENNYNTVFVSDLIDYVYNGKPLPQNPILLTFDDGYFNNYTYAMPLLEKYNAKIELSIIGKHSDIWSEFSGSEDEINGHLTWEQISELEQSGYVELANHTQDMHDNNSRFGCAIKNGESDNNYSMAFSEDIETLQNSFLNNCGVKPECFTYPYGKICSQSVAALKEHGFKATLSTNGGIAVLNVGDEECLYGLKRNNRSPNNSVQKILNSYS